MPRSLTSLLLLAATAVSAAAAAPASAATPVPIAAEAAAPRSNKSCARIAPSKLRFDRKSGKTYGTLRWSVRGPKRGTIYRVWRGRAVVGQTTAHRMRVKIRIRRAYLFRVSPVRAGRPMRCASRKRIKITYRLASTPKQVAVVDAGVAKLTWKASKRGDAKLSGYRVLRDGAVVGQTKATSMSAPMGGKATYRFAVAAVDAKGKMSPASRPVTVTRGHRAPSEPAGLAVESSTESSVDLTWAPSQVQGATIKAYRVFRDGAMVGQFASTKAKVGGLRLNTDYGFTVQAVDSLGYLSKVSAVLRARAGAHVAPSSPTGLTASAVSESEVDLAWRGGVATNGRVVGYRISRDGLPIGQHPGTTIRIGRLAAATTHTFSVQTADNHGFLSAPAQVSVRTQEPVPTSGHAVAFLLASTDQSFKDFQAHYRQIGTVSPTYFDCSTQGALTGKDDPLITGWAKARKVVVLPRFNCQRTATLTRILNEPELREQWIAGIVERVEQTGADGATLDFEAGLASDRNAYTAFTAELAARLHARNKRLMMAVSAKTADVLNHPRSSFFDYRELSKHVDTIFVMAWGIHWATSAPGAQDDAAWVRKVADYVATMPDPRRFVLGMQLYGMDWRNGGGAANPAESYEYGDVQGLLGAKGATTVYDPAQDALHASYTDNSGRHDLWYTDAATQGRRLDLARAKGLGGVGFWRLGKEDQRLWEHPVLQPGAAW